MSTYTYPPTAGTPASETALFLRDVKTYNTSRTLLQSDITTIWDTTIADITITLFAASAATYDNTFHRYRIVNGGTHNLHISSPSVFWNDSVLHTLTVLPKRAITISAARVGAVVFWTFLEDLPLSYSVGTGTSTTIAGAPIILPIGAVTSDLSETTITKDTTNTIIGASGDYRYSGTGIVVDNGGTAVKLGYLTLKINRSGTILSRSSFSIITKGTGASYNWFIPQQTVTLLAGDKVYFEFEPNTIVNGSVQLVSLDILRTVAGV